MFDRIILEMHEEHGYKSDRHLLYFIIHKLNSMSAQNDALVQGMQTLSTNLGVIKAGVAKLVSNLPAEGGLTADETAALGSSLADLVNGSTEIVNSLPADPAPTV